jgi:hypothetical protein
MSANDNLKTEDLLYAMQQRNLVYNYNFLNYSNKTVDTLVTYNHPDGWVYNDSGTGGLVSFDPTTNSCMIKKSTGNSLMTFMQTINEFPRWTDLLLGKKVSACALIEVPGTSSCEVTFSISDGKSISSKSIFFNPGEQKEINISIDVSLLASTLFVSVECSTSEVVLYINKIYANLGDVALEGLPCIVEGTIGERKQYMSTEVPPAVELSLCNASVELSSSYSRLNSFLNGKFGTGTNGNSLLPDMRGYFSRAWDNGATTDPDAANRTALGQGTVTGDHVGTVEQDQFKEHVHQLQFDLSGQIPAGTSAAMPSINKMLTSNTGKVGGSETRSKNISELYTMKWA